jgi:hypothetical protein
MLEQVVYLVHLINQNHDAALFWVTAILAVATFAVAMYTAKLATETRKLREGSDAALGEQVANAKRAATAAEESARAAGVTAESTRVLVETANRAWVLMTALRLDPDSPTLPAQTNVSIKVENLGHTPATELTVDDFLEVHIGEVPANLVYPINAPHSNYYLGPGQHVLMVQRIALDPNTLAEISAGRSKLVSAGHLKYRDFRGVNRETVWCCVFSPAYGAFIAADLHNRCTWN